MNKIINKILGAHFLLTASTFVYLLFILLNPHTSFKLIAEKGPITNGYALITSCILLWLLVTSILILIKFKKINEVNFIPIICSTVLSLLYLTFLREHLKFGDISDYLIAVENIINGEPFHERYLYPPMWASFLTHIFRYLGLAATIFVIYIINHLSIIAFFFLASLFISKFGVSLNLSSILVFGTMVVNVGITRNIVYCQVNLLLVDLVLASVLLFNKNKFLSSLFYSLGIHLKVAPLFFLPVFLKFKNWKWFLYLLATGMAITLITIYTDGISYYYSFIHNLTSWADAPIRSSSIFSFLVNTKRITGLNIPVSIVWNSIRLFMAIGVYSITYLVMKQNVFLKIDDNNKNLKAMIPIFFLMIVISPTVWSHHLVILIVPVILLLLHIEKIGELFIFGIAYFLTYLLPIFDVYPFSYLRLIGWLTLLGFVIYFLLNKRSYGKWVMMVDDELNKSFLNFFKIFKN